jgi:hypothetical protein
MGQTLFSTTFLPTQPSPFVIVSGHSAHFEPMIFLNNSLDIQKLRKATCDTVFIQITGYFDAQSTNQQRL